MILSTYCSVLGVDVFVHVVGGFDKARHAAAVEAATLKFISHHTTLTRLGLEGVGSSGAAGGKAGGGGAAGGGGGRDGFPPKIWWREWNGEGGRVDARVGGG